MQVQFIKPWSIYQAGAVIEMPGGQADMLIRRRFVEEYVAPQPVVVSDELHAQPSATIAPTRRGRTQQRTSDN